MKALFNKKQVKKNWKKFLKEEDFLDYYSIYKAIQCSIKSLMLQMSDFLYAEDIYKAFLELVEVDDTINIMLSDNSPEVKQLCKERIDFFLKYRAKNWWL